MRVEVTDRLGAGQFGDLYRGIDELGREVAIKFIRSSAGGGEFALSQAKALARSSHPNVVAVYAIERLADPATGSESTAILMELIHGVTLRDLCQQQPMTIAEAARIGEGVLDGIEHIHKQGLQHGDLHLENVLVGLGQVKVIDILYYSTLAVVSTQSREDRLAQDITALRTMFRTLLNNTQIDPARAADFSAGLNRDATLADIRTEFRKALGIGPPVLSSQLQLDVAAQVKQYLSDDRYRIPLHDLVQRELNSVRHVIEGTAFDLSQPQPTTDTIRDRVELAERVTDTLIRIAATGSMWGTPEKRDLWRSCVSKLVANRSRAGTTYNVWRGMERYPALLVLYGCGIGALAGANYGNLQAVLDLEVEHEELLLPVTNALHPTAVLLQSAAVLLPGQEGQAVPQSNRLFNSLREPLRDLVFNDAEFSSLFDQYEYLQALVAIDAKEPAYVGRFGYKLSHPIADAEAKRIRLQSIGHLLVAAGLFSGSQERFKQARDKLEKFIASGALWR